MSDPIRILTFTGTRAEFFHYLDSDEFTDTFVASASVADEAYEWEVTAAISRHPAGKKLGRDPKLYGTESYLP